MSNTLSHSERNRIVDWFSSTPFFKTVDVPHEFDLEENCGFRILGAHGFIVCKLSGETVNEILADESSAKALRLKIHERIESYHRAPLEERILTALKERPLQSREVAATLGIRSGSARNYLLGLVRVGLVERLNQYPLPVYRLSQTSPSED